jgi:hypothetical protein
MALKWVRLFTLAADNSATLERPETPPKPSSNVPFRRDPDFVDRDSIFNQIEEKCAVLGSWTALVGLGGVG